MNSRGIILFSVFVSFILLVFPQISAVRLNEIKSLEKSLSDEIPKIITEQIDEQKFLKINNSALLVVVSLLLDIIAYRLIVNNYTELALFILLINFIIIVEFMD